MKTFKLTVSSVTETKFDGEAISVHVPAESGEMEVLAQHEPMITTLKAGTITIKTDTDSEKFAIEKGVLEVANNKVVVLV